MSIEEERKAFEAWQMNVRGRTAAALSKADFDADSYESPWIDDQWIAWQARAALDKREPLTDAQLLDLIPIIQSAWSISDMCLWYARAIERAHGIGSEK